MKQLTKLVAIAVVATSLLSVGTAAAATSKESAFCTNLSSYSSKITSNITNLTGKLTTARGDEDKKVADNRSKWDAEIAADRAKADGDRQANFTKLEAKATTDAEKSAVKTYETAVLAAVSTRRTANDKARDVFRAGVDSLRANRRSTIDAQVTIFSASVNSAISTAQTACAANSSASNGPAIRTAFIASLKSARETFQADRQTDIKIGDDIRALAQTRNATVKANDATFLATTAAARDALKAAFGTKASSI